MPKTNLLKNASLPETQSDISPFNVIIWATQRFFWLHHGQWYFSLSIRHNSNNTVSQLWFLCWHPLTKQPTGTKWHNLIFLQSISIAQIRLLLALWKPHNLIQQGSLVETHWRFPQLPQFLLSCSSLSKIIKEMVPNETIFNTPAQQCPALWTSLLPLMSWV